MGTHSKLGLTRSNGTHVCVERTQDGGKLMGLLGDWEDSEVRGGSIWTPQEPVDAAEMDVLFKEAGAGSMERDPGEQEGEQEYFVHVDWERKEISLNPETYAGVWGPGAEHAPRLGKGWRMRWAWDCRQHDEGDTARSTN